MHVCSLHIYGVALVSKHKLLAHFEEHAGLGPTYAAQLLGVPYSTYAQFRNGTRPLKTHTERHIQALEIMSLDTLQLLIKEHVRDGWKD